MPCLLKPYSLVHVDRMPDISCFSLAPADLMHDIPQGNLKWLFALFTNAIFTYTQPPEGEARGRREYYWDRTAPAVERLLHSWQRYNFPTGLIYTSEKVNHQQSEMPNSNRLSLALYMLLLLLSPSALHFFPPDSAEASKWRRALAKAFWCVLETYHVYKYRVLPKQWLGSGEARERLGEYYLQLLTKPPLSQFRMLQSPTQSTQTTTQPSSGAASGGAFHGVADVGGSSGQDQQGLPQEGRVTIKDRNGLFRRHERVWLGVDIPGSEVFEMRQWWVRPC